MTAIFAKQSMENHLNEEEKAAARAFEAMAENSLMMTVSFLRYTEHLDDVFQLLPNSAFGVFTPILKILLKMRMSRKVCLFTSHALFSFHTSFFSGNKIG